MFRVQFAGVLLSLLFVVADVSASEPRRIGEHLQRLLSERNRALQSLGDRAAQNAATNRLLNQELVTACSIDPGDFTDAHLVVIAECCLVTHRFEDCIRYTTAAVQKDSGSDSANSLLIRALVFLKRLDEAAIALEAAKKWVGPTSRVRGLHSIIYFQAAAAKEWERSVPNIEKHIDYLIDASTTHPQDSVQPHFWIDQLALAYKKTIPDEQQRQKQIDVYWNTITSIPKVALPPFREPSFRAKCEVLELKCAIEINANHGVIEQWVLEWLETIIDSGAICRDWELANESTFLCQFVQVHRRDLAPAIRARIATKLKELETATFRMYPSPPLRGLLATLHQSYEVLEDQRPAH